MLRVSLCHDHSNSDDRILEKKNALSTVEPLLKDSPNKGHHINYLPTKDTFLGPKNELSYSVK